MIACDTPVGGLLDSLIPALHYIPAHAHRVRSAEDLPAALRAQTSTPACGVWRAWRDGTRVWFVSGECISRGDEARLYVAFFDADARFAAAGVWRKRDGGWMLEFPATDRPRSVTGRGPICAR